MGTDLILSTSKKYTFLLALLILGSGCADKKIRPIIDVGGPREQTIAYDINPAKSSGRFVDIFIVLFLVL